MTDVEASQLITDFQELRIPPMEFTHRKHLEVAYAMLKRDGFLESVYSYSKVLKRFAASAGVPQKFNQTVTIVFLSVMSERMANGDYEGFEDFISKNEDLLSTKLMHNWYSKEEMRSRFAKTHFLMPKAAD